MMLIVQRLYLKEFISVLSIIGIGLSTIFGIIGLIDKIDNFITYNPPLSLLFMYFLYSIPRYLLYLLPMAILLSSLFVFSIAIKRKEIVAIKASAGRIKYLLSPFILTGVLLVLFGFVLGEIIVPVFSMKNKDITNRIIKKQKSSSFKEGVLYLKGKDGDVIRIGLYVPEGNLSREVSIYKIGKDGIEERIDAEEAHWLGGQWRLEDVKILNFRNGKVASIKELDYEGIPSLEVFRSEALKIEEMTIIELIRYHKRLKDAGFKNIKLLVDINSRLSYSLVNLFMLILGMSLSLSHDFSENRLFKLLTPHKVKESNIGGGIIAGGLGFLISMTYWFGYSFCLSLGYAGAIPPILAPWLMPIIFGAISFYLYNLIPE